MRKIQWKKWNIPWKLVVLGAMLALLSGVFGEVIFNWNCLTNTEKKGSQDIDNAVIAAEGCEIEDGLFVATGKKMSLTVKFPRQYVNKVHYTYMSPYVNVDSTLKVHTKNGYGADTVVSFEDKSSILRDFSVVRVNKVCDEIELIFQKPTDGLVVTSVGISDEPSFSKMRFLFFGAAALLIYLLLLSRRTLEHHLERMFLVIALPIGLLMILGFSPREAGWDEHIHFYRAYSLIYDFMGKDTMPVTDHMYTYMNTGMANEPFYFPRSQEENAQERAYGEIGRQDEEQTKLYQATNGFHIYSIAYLPQTLLLAVGLLLKVPFWILVSMGRVGNLAFYCLMCYIAIRHMKWGKGLLLVISLFPTSLFLAATYSYDAFINGCMLVGMSYLFTEVMDTKKTVSMRNLGIFAAMVVLASLPKAVYIPLILLGFLVPANRFENKKAAWIFRGILLVCFLLLLATFVMPTGGGGAEAISDTRGGDTSVSRQLALIFSHPFAYASLLLRSIGENLVYCLFGKSVAGNLAYRGVLRSGLWICPFIIFAIFTGNTREYGESLKKWQRLFIGILVFGVLCLVWTALYLSFTPVGENQINGVQARYYIPVLVPAYLALQCTSVRNRMKMSVYHQILAAGSLFFLLDGLWTGVIAMCF